MRLWNRASKRTALAAAAAVLLTVLPSGEGVAGPDRILDDPAGREVPWAGLPSALRSAPDVEELVREHAPEMRSRFAGGWFDASGKIKVAVTTGELPSALASHHRVEAVRHRFSLEYLDDVIDSVASRLNALLAGDWDLEGSWPFFARVNVWDNVVEVEFDPSQAERSDDIEQELAEYIERGAVRVLGYERRQYFSTGSLHEEKLPDLDLGNPCLPGDLCVNSQWTTQCGTRANCGGYFRGGTRATAAVPCTLGFVMRDSFGVRFQSTAGHCSDSNGTVEWKHAGRSIGKAEGTRNSGGVDFKVIGQRNQNEPAPRNLIYRAGDQATLIGLKITNPNNELLGNNLCTEGARSGARCGTLTHLNATDSDGQTGMGQTSAVTCSGDSGAPVVADSTNRAYGVHSGILSDAEVDPDCGSPTVFTWVPRLEAWSGMEVLRTAVTEGLGPGQRLPRGDLIVARNSGYYLLMQSDGNLVMYRSSDGKALWATGTNGPNRFAVMQNDGNLVVYGQGCSGACWASGTSGANRRLVIQNDGNLVIYTQGGTPVWSRHKGKL